ncbi:MAG: HigA family addiction module antitoxin [Treponema sp.]|nr:HigA family addiction module antitoxin [Treponema sp.]
MAKKTLQSPGAFLTDLLEKNHLNPFKLSRDIHLSQSAVRLIALGETRISVPVALRLARYFNTNPEFWLNMQMKWDLAEASKDKALMNIVNGISKFTKDPASGKKPIPRKPPVKKAASSKRGAAPKKAAAKKAAPKKKKPAAAKAKRAGRGRAAK